MGWMKRKKSMISAMLALVLVLSQAVTVLAADPDSQQNVSGDRSTVIDQVYNTVGSAVYFTDFGDSEPLTPANWGFTTATSATLSVYGADVGGNATSKLAFTQTNQSGGRVATKKLEKPVTGGQMLVHFDWYPGMLNDKGKNPENNGGDFRLFDNSGMTFFTIRNIKDQPLAFFAGSQAITNTQFTNPNSWYTIDVYIDLSADQMIFGMKEKSTGIYEEYTISIKDVVFDGFIDSIKLVGIRTSGNNITWSTYLDNFSIRRIAVPDNTIIKVNKLPYHTVFVNQTTADVNSIGLPATVTLTLADNKKVSATVAQWSSADGTWDPQKEGIYKFTGTVITPDGLSNDLNRSLAICYVYNRLNAPEQARSVEWLDRGAVALKADNGIFVSWRLLATEYAQDVAFNIYKNGAKLNAAPLTASNYKDVDGVAGDLYTIETLLGNEAVESTDVTASTKDYLAFALQKPEGGTTASGAYTYSANDASVGDLDGDGEYEIIVKWYPSNAIDSSQTAMTGPTIFDAYKLDGTLLWRMNMGLNLTSGAHYNQFIVADFDQDGKSEMMIKTADATVVYGATDGKYDSSKVISVIGDISKNGAYVNKENNNGHIIGGPEFMTVFEGQTGKAIDTVEYAFPLGEDGGASWGDTWWNRSDRFLAGLAYLDGKKPSAVFGRGYYERTTYVAYSLVDGKLIEEWTFDSAQEGRGKGLGFHSVSTGDVDNDGKDEIVAGSLTLDHDGSILYAMDGNMQREMGSHGDALHLGAFDPDREGLQVFAVHEVPEVASVELHDAATGETLQSYYAYKDTGRGLIANITPSAGHEFWGAAGSTIAEGGAVYNVQTGSELFPKPGLSVNFALYWDGDLLQELMNGAYNDNVKNGPVGNIVGGSSITKYNNQTKAVETLRTFPDTVSSNGTKATPTLQADILGDWREEIVLPTADSSEMRIYSTTAPTEYRLYTLMHDPVYRNAIAAQNTAYNQPPHLSFYLGEDVKSTVLAGGLKVPNVKYTNEKLPYAIEYISFTDFAGNTVTHLAGSGDILVKATVRNQAKSTQDVTLIVALYNADNTMKNYSLVKWNSKNGLEQTLQAGFHLPDDVQGHKVKVFVWNNTTDMKPFSNVEILE